MNALTLSEYKHLAMEDVPLPTCGPNDILVQVAACGICGSDVHGYDGSTGRRIPPIVMGHEAAGIVAAVGAEVTSVALGDRVTFDSTVYCAKCEFCLRGEINLCEDRQVVGVSCGEFRRAGAFAEYITVPEYIVYKLPPSLGFADAAMLEAVSVALHAVKLSQIEGGEIALVIGAGMIGLLVLQAALEAGCSRVFVADVDATRLEMAARLGATETLHASEADVVSEVLRLTNGRGSRCRARGCRSQRDGRYRDRLRSQGGQSDAGGQHRRASYYPAAESCYAANPAAGIVRLRRRIS